MKMHAPNIQKPKIVKDQPEKVRKMSFTDGVYRDLEIWSVIRRLLDYPEWFTSSKMSCYPLTYYMEPFFLYNKCKVGELLRVLKIANNLYNSF